MNTNSNVYTVIYTTIVVVVVAAVLAFVSIKLGPSQQANEKAETLRQMMVAAQVGTSDELYASKNNEVLQLYADNIQEAFTIGLDGEKNGELDTDKANIQLVGNLKPQDRGIKADGKVTLPVYVFKSGKTVIPVYGAGLWGPIWGYVAFETDGKTIAGAYFDHSSETPGLGAKIKDEPWFREKFIGKTAEFASEEIFTIAKNAEAEGATNAVDAITGATMTSKGLNEAVNVWLGAYKPFFQKNSGRSCCGKHEAGHCPKMVDGKCCGNKAECANADSLCCKKHAEGQCCEKKGECKKDGKCCDKKGECKKDVKCCEKKGECKKDGKCCDKKGECKKDGKCCEKKGECKKQAGSNCNVLNVENEACNGSCEGCPSKSGCKNNK